MLISVHISVPSYETCAWHIHQGSGQPDLWSLVEGRAKVTTVLQLSQGEGTSVIK